MISVEKALSLILDRVESRPPTEVDVADAVGLCLAEDVAGDMDSPPHDKAMVDGYAVIAGDLADGHAVLDVLEEVTAGAVPSRPVSPGSATRIMTGAPLPQGADAVVMVEHTTLVEPGRVEIHISELSPGKHMMPQGQSLRAGEVVLSAGTEIRPIEVGLLSEVGRTKVKAIRRPRVAVLATGNELVPAGQAPGAGMIRNSNGPMLLAAIAAAGATPRDLGIARDEHGPLAESITRGLNEADVLLLSGGVSAGVLDLVPQVLQELGVEQVFHQVEIKPGKPLWFGTKTNPQGDRYVFGLPGNPISGFVCFQVFVQPAMSRLAGRLNDQPLLKKARLNSDFRHLGNRPTYYPAVLHEDANGAVVEPVAWHGSADIRGFAAANCLAVFPAGDCDHRPGDEVRVVTFR